MYKEKKEQEAEEERIIQEEEEEKNRREAEKKERKGELIFVVHRNWICIFFLWITFNFLNSHEFTFQITQQKMLIREIVSSIKERNIKII